MFYREKRSSALRKTLMTKAKRPIVARTPSQRCYVPEPRVGRYKDHSWHARLSSTFLPSELFVDNWGRTSLICVNNEFISLTPAVAAAGDPSAEGWVNKNSVSLNASIHLGNICFVCESDGTVTVTIHANVCSVVPCTYQEHIAWNETNLNSLSFLGYIWLNLVKKLMTLILVKDFGFTFRFRVMENVC